MTEARRVRLKNYFGIGRPSQSQYISFANIDWDQRDAHELRTYRLLRREGDSSLILYPRNSFPLSFLRSILSISSRDSTIATSTASAATSFDVLNWATVRKS